VNSRSALGRIGVVACAGWLAVMPAAWVAEGASSTSDGRSLKEMVHRLQQHYRSTSSFKAKFKERIESASGAKRERQGVIAYRRPGRMRWDFAPPENETIVSDGMTLYVYEPDLNQVVETPLERAFRSSAPAALLLGMGDVERDFVALPPPPPPAADKLVHLVLKPKADGVRIALGLDPKTYDIRALAMTDELGNVTSLEFSDIQTNLMLDDAMFSFRAPEGVDIVTAPNSH